MATPEHAVTLTRTIAAPAAEVYASLTDHHAMDRWLGQVEADPRVGGRYRFELDDGAGGLFVQSGEYLVLKPDRRILLSLAADRTLELRLHDLSPAQTELTLVEAWSGPPRDAAARDAAAAAWTHWLDHLETAVIAPPQAPG